MNKLIVTHYKNRVLTALISESEVLELSIAPEDSELGNIYTGRVTRVVKNLNSAFIDYAPSKTGYYSLTDDPEVLLSSGGSKKPAAGDEVIVQVSKEAVKSKEPSLTANLNFAGRYAVLTPLQRSVGFSAKITDHEWKEAIRPGLEKLLGTESGVIVRTNAYGQDEKLFDEIKILLDRYREVLSKARTRMPLSLLYAEEPEYLKSIRNAPRGSLSEIVTDDEEIFRAIEEELFLYEPEDKDKLTLYKDKELPLLKLCSLESALKQAQQKKVWLRSGGYIVIEPTEAMVVIDVNTGKYSGNISMDAAIKKTNSEAAAEICYQLRLRNLSGIIMIDFIDMKSEEDRALLLSELRKKASLDPVKTTVVDLTQLGLVEMTRKKERKPLYEQLKGLTS